MKKKIISVVGARPNFMKVAPLHKAFLKYGEALEHLICHTGQHYDEKMSKVFFDDLELPKPHFYLGIGSGSHAVQTGKVMIEFEQVLLEQRPDLVIVVGDVNSTVACSLVAAKLHIPVAHVEAGLRSFDRTMPEEINRLLTDAIAELLFVTERSGIENLKREGVPDEKVFLVGNVMIDSLLCYLPKAASSGILSDLAQQFGAGSVEPYILVTLHRPSNVDDEKFLRRLIRTFNVLAEKSNIIFPVHPRTDTHLKRLSLNGDLARNVYLTEPIGYLDFLHLTKHAVLIITDSGGIQEESTYLGIQCITVRDNTERPVTVEVGTNQLIGTDLAKVEEAALRVLGGEKKAGKIPELWDGRAAERIAEVVYRNLLKTT